jgi:hypothetical protein
MPEPEETTELETDDTDQDGEDQESTDFESINPDDLPQELRPIYDKMMASYTQATQGLSAYENEVGTLRQDSETLEYLLSNSDIRKIAMGMDSGQQETKPVELPKIDPATDPAGYLAQLVENAVDRKVSAQNQKLMDQLSPLISDRNQSIAKTEWENVLNKYPSARDINVTLINQKLATNPNLSLEEAAILVKPDIVVKSMRTTKGVPTKIEVSTRRSSTQKEELSSLSRSAQLRESYAKQKDGTTIQSIIRGVMNKVGGGK